MPPLSFKDEETKFPKAEQERKVENRQEGLTPEGRFFRRKNSDRTAEATTRKRGMSEGEGGQNGV